MTAAARTVAPPYRTSSRPATADAPLCVSAADFGAPRGTRTGAASRGAVLAAAPGTSLAASAARDPYARLARGCKPRGCRAPARRVHGRRVRYVIGSEPGQVNGMRWRAVRACDCH
ncbi:tryptophan synthase subunit(beta) [Streptomyces sp. NBC_01210]|nr:tryptophan synthase subunit(beta) [Streptomyces sp. NBC_01210]